MLERARRDPDGEEAVRVGVEPRVRGEGHRPEGEGVLDGILPDRDEAKRPRAA